MFCKQQHTGRILVLLFLCISAYILLDFRSFNPVGEIDLLTLEAKGIETGNSSGVPTDDDDDDETDLGSAWVSSQQRNRKIAYIDIAMEPGSLVRDTLQSHRAEGSPLSHAVHLGQALEELEQQPKVNAFLFETSNPIRRAIYAYNQLHPANITTTATKRVRAAKADEKNRDQFYTECFPSQTHLLDGISAIFQQVSQNNTLTECQKLVLRVLQGKEERLKNVNEYLFFNTGYYLANSIERHPFFEVFVVRREVIWEDLASLDEFLGGPVGGSKTFKDREQEETPPPVPSPSKAQSKQLCCIMWQELARYQQILDRAQNLSDEDKEGTVIDLIDTCSVISKDKENVASASSILRDGYGVNWPKWYELTCPNLEPFLGV